MRFRVLQRGHNTVDEDDLISNLAQEHVIRASGLLALLIPETTGVGIAIKALDGRYQFANKALEDLLGRTPQQIVACTDADIFPPPIALQLQSSDREIIDGVPATSDELDLSTARNDTLRLWLKFPLLAPDGQIQSIGVLVLDATKRDTIAQVKDSLEDLKRINRELCDSLKAMEILASTDKLTGVWNRRRLQEAVSGELDRLMRYEHPLSLMIIDLDFFKEINDHHGHAVGDQVLVQVATTMQTNLRASDSLTRWGGDEFIVLCPDTTFTTCTALAKRLHQEVKRAQFPLSLSLTVSIGVAECRGGDTWDQWLQRADAALYKAKGNGRDQVQIDRGNAGSANAQGKARPKFVHLSWHAAYECGNQIIDEQHAGLFADVNALLAALLSSQPKDKVAALIGTLNQNIAQHFHDEEEILVAAGYVGAVQHAALHTELVNRGIQLTARFYEDTLDIGELFQYLAYDVVARHFLGADLAFFPFVQNEHVGAS